MKKIITLVAASLMIQAAWAVDPFTVELYNNSCALCHDSGAGEAPKSFVPDEWQDRLAKGQAQVLSNIISGYKGMPPLGMCSDCMKEDFIDLIDYMTSEKPL